MKEKNLLNKRYFINPDKGVAATSASVLVVYDLGGKKYPALELDAELSLSDCNRQITLEFDFYPGNSRSEMQKKLKQRRQKLERLKSIVDEFVEATSAGYDFIEDNIDEYLAARKARAAKDKKDK